jgi:hypothetical protein
LSTIKIDRDKTRANFARAPLGTRCTENRPFSGPAIRPPALTPECAGASGDRSDLSADDWTALPIAEPVAAAAIGSAVGSFADAGAAMRSDSIVPQQEQKN